MMNLQAVRHRLSGESDTIHKYNYIKVNIYLLLVLPTLGPAVGAKGGRIRLFQCEWALRENLSRYPPLTLRSITTWVRLSPFLLLVVRNEAEASETRAVSLICCFACFLLCIIYFYLSVEPKHIAITLIKEMKKNTLDSSISENNYK